MPSRPVLALCALVLVAGCATFPQLDAAVSDETWRADYPELLPVDDLRMAAVPRSTGRNGATTLVASAGPDPATTDAIDARAARLRARAAGLRGDVIDAAAKERLDTDIGIDEEDV